MAFGKALFMPLAEGLGSDLIKLSGGKLWLILIRLCLLICLFKLGLFFFNLLLLGLFLLKKALFTL